jgi:hypothetical protein
MSKELEFKIEAADGIPDLWVTCTATFNQIDQQQTGNGIAITDVDIRDNHDTKIHPYDLPEDTRNYLYEEAENLARKAFGRAF